MTGAARCRFAGAVLALIAILVAWPPASHAQGGAGTADLRRVAILVGANEASPGRRALRYAHNDARAVERVLRRVGQFERDDIHVLLDPSPATVLSLLDNELRELRESGTETLLLFYYSGHADAAGLYPNGESLSFQQLRRRLESDAAGVRVGIIDACRGGGWTGTRGLTETETFEVNTPLDLSNEGSVLISSSSGLEDAHESEELEGGFFTHHWNAGLRGAADRNGDRAVTLSEAFEYAKHRTIRDTALRADVPQHPSFRMNLQGRQDLTLAHLGSRATTLTVEQEHGPLQLFHLGTGHVVLELPEGERTARLSIAPGRYLLRSTHAGTIKASELHVRQDRPLSLREGDLEVVDEVFLAARGIGGPVRPINLSTLPQGTSQFQAAIGIVRSGTEIFFASGQVPPPLAAAGRLNFSLGVTDHLQLVLPLPALVLRASFGGLDVLPWAGLHESRYPISGINAAPGFGFYGQHLIDGGVRGLTHDAFAVSAALGGGVDVRYRLASNNSFIAGLALRTPMLWITERFGAGSGIDNFHGPDRLMASVMVGGSVTIDQAVTVSLAAQWDQLVDGGEPYPILRVGAVQGFGLRPLPLIRVHVDDQFSIDGYFSFDYDLFDQAIEETYLFGASYVW